MKLKDLSSILYSKTGNIQFAIVYDYENNRELEHGCSIDYAVANYGDYKVKRITSCFDFSEQMDYLVIHV